MIVTLIVHTQIPIYWQRKDNIPKGLQFLLRLHCGAAGFHAEQLPRRRDKIFCPPVNLIKNRFIRIQNVYAALTYGVMPLPNVNMVAVEEHGELVIGVRIGNIGALPLLLHDVPPLYPMEFWHLPELASTY